MKIVKVYKETLPCVRLIGKRFTNQDRDASGTFASYWQQCFQEGWPDKLKPCEGIPGISEHLIGAMRMSGDGGDFEYFIGAFFAPSAVVPEGFVSVEIPAGDVGVCWLYGSDKNGELFSMEASNLAMAALAEKGFRFYEQGWFFERYHCPRFTAPDEKGNVILDICAYLI